MNKKSSKAPQHKTVPAIDWAAVEAAPAADVSDEESPSLTVADARTLQPIAAVLPALVSHKTRITIMLDDDILNVYKTRAGGRGYQTLINDTLRRALEADHLKEVLRQVLREERGQYRS